MASKLGIEKIEKNLFALEEQLDLVLTENRKIVRNCSNAIKALHAHDFSEAEKNLAEAKKDLSKLLPYQKELPSQVDHVLQQYAEAMIVQYAVKTGKLPSQKELDIPDVPYLNGLLDAIGELKREMYESLRRKDKKKAELYFSLMEEIFDALLPLRFSNAILPEFRRKQDVGRIQIEQARGELL